MRAIQIFVAAVAGSLIVWLLWACIATAVDNIRNAPVPDEEDD